MRQLFVALLVLLSGCIGGRRGGDDDDDQSWHDPTPGMCQQDVLDDLAQYHCAPALQWVDNCPDSLPDREYWDCKYAQACEFCGRTSAQNCEQTARWCNDTILPDHDCGC